ncbi:MAG: DNA polymerase III subunit beta [Pseudomonadales bacterium]|nr:DNA polymerase III subunit beta [Pseudomonadales bacterium]
MKFTITRETLLKPLQLVAGVVEKRQTLPVLSNVLITVENNEITLTGTDLEVEMACKIPLDDKYKEGAITTSARKLLDIVRSLPEGANIKISEEKQKVTVKSGSSRFTLSCLPATDFPNVEDEVKALNITLAQKALKRLIDRTAFSMAQQDVRYYLNGMLLEVTPTHLRAVSTDGHRLAMCSLENNNAEVGTMQVIIPRKGVIELQRLLQDTDDEVVVSIGNNQLRATLNDFIFTSKLVDGKFPDYQRVLPKGGDKVVIAERGLLKQSFARASILSNEKYRGVRLFLSEGLLTMTANNPEQEEAQEQVAVDYNGDELEIGFNVSYLVEALNALSGEEVKLILSDSNSSALLEENTEDNDSAYVVMPMRL